MNNTLVDAFLDAKDVLTKQPVCDYETSDYVDPEYPLVTISGPVCTIHGGVPTGDPPLRWGWCDKVDPQIPLLRKALNNLLQHMHLEVVPDRSNH